MKNTDYEILINKLDQIREAAIQLFYIDQENKILSPSETIRLATEFVEEEEEEGLLKKKKKKKKNRGVSHD